MSHRCTEIQKDGGRINIFTTRRRAEAILLVMSGTTHQEAADALGVTRQRIHQYMGDAGLNAKMRHRFAPSKTNTFNLKQFQRACTRTQRRRERKHIRMQNAIEILRFHAAEGRHLTQCQLASVLKGKYVSQGGPYLCAYLGRARTETTKLALRRVRFAYQKAGLIGGHKGWPRSEVLKAGWKALSPRERAKRVRVAAEGRRAFLLQRKAGKSE